MKIEILNFFCNIAAACKIWSQNFNVVFVFTYGIFL